MKKLFMILLLALTASFSFGQGAPVPQKFVIVAGTDKYSQPVATTLEEANAQTAYLVSLFNQLAVLYLADSAQNAPQLEKLLGSASDTAATAATEDKALKKATFAKVKTFALGGYVLANPLPVVGGYSYGAGPQVLLNVFDSFVLSVGVGLEVDAKDLRPQIQVGLTTWLF